MLHMPTPMLMGGPQGKGYPEFLAHITGLATGGVVSFSSGVKGGYFRTVLAESNYMMGTSWSGMPGYNGFGEAVVSSAVRHGLPNQAVFEAIVSAGHQVFFQVNQVSNDSQYVTGGSRNGLTSVSGTTNNKVFILIQIRYWDDFAKQAMIMDPYAATGPTPYVIP